MLPYDILLKILRYSDPSTVIQSTKLNKFLNNKAKGNIIWKPIVTKLYSNEKMSEHNKSFYRIFKFIKAVIKNHCPLCCRSFKDRYCIIICSCFGSYVSYHVDCIKYKYGLLYDTNYNPSDGRGIGNCKCVVCGCSSPVLFCNQWS